MNTLLQQIHPHRASPFAWTREQQGIGPSAKIVLYALAAFHVDINGYGCLTLTGLARDAEQSQDTVRRRLRALEKQKLTERIFGSSVPVPKLWLGLDHHCALDLSS